MGFIKVKHKGNFNKTERFFNRVLKKNYRNILAKYGQMGVDVLSAATPSESGKTASSWNYGISEEKGKVTLYWTNSNQEQGVCIAVLLIYGHALPNGAFVEGNDFVTPAMKPIFRQIANESWKEVVR